MAMVMFLLTAVLIVVYFIARRAFIVISSAGEPLEIEAKGMSRERLTGFIEALERAKLTKGKST